MYKIYRLYRRIVLSDPSPFGPLNLDNRRFDTDWTPTQITFKARNEKEAMKKAQKFWKRGQFGMSSIMVREE